VEIIDGIRRVTFPLPTGPSHVHAYLLPGPDGYTLVDTGLGLPDLEERWAAVELDRPVARIFITHFHPDHVGGGAQTAELHGGVPVSEGELDFAQCVRVWGSDDWEGQMAGWFQRHGVPAGIADELLDTGSAFRPFIRYAPAPTLIHAGDEIDGWQVEAFTGHADGQLCLQKDGVFIAGDHLLPGITPAVGLWPESRPDPLGDYLESLRRTIELAPRLALPGHGEPIEDPAGRAQEIVDHHVRRLDDTQAALRQEPQTGYELSFAVFPRDLSTAHRRFAVAETLSHVERLVVEGRAARTSDDSTVAYTAA
jgi:glyoxylase-like metal-dependent hydrolase (beta-lactamase superfamily II)